MAREIGYLALCVLLLSGLGTAEVKDEIRILEERQEEAIQSYLEYMFWVLVVSARQKIP